MSGIGGMMQRAGSPSDFVLSSLAKSLQHRGPDAIKGEVYSEVGFVYTRLSVIDIEGCSQPIHGNNLSLIANAEIFNAQEIKDKFPNYPFKTETDCESILPLYRKYGEEFANHISGSYALALYDENEKTLYISRDPFGIKSLYYWEGITGFAFASEPQAILNAKIVTPNLNPLKAYNFLSINYLWGKDTLFKDIHRVLPGETIVIKKGQVIKRLFRHAISKGPPKKTSVDESFDSLDKVLNQSIATHLRSNLRYGIVLSNDVESACLLKLISQYTQGPIKTFSITYSGNMEERENINNLAKSFNTDHQDLLFEESDFWSLLPKLMEILDDPTIDPHALATYKLAESAAKSVKVLFTGIGANELFGAQKHENAMKSWWLGGSAFNKEDRLKKCKFMRVKNEALWEELDQILIQLERLKLSKLQLAQAIDLELTLPNNVLLKFDRCLMANGIEGRMPFLDSNVAEISFHLPDHLKLKDKTPQWLLREWLQKNAPDVMRFLKPVPNTIPVEEWVSQQGKEIGHLVAQQEGIKQICRLSEVEVLFTSNKQEMKTMAWNLLCFALWHQVHILGKPALGDVKTTLNGGDKVEDPELIMSEV